MIPPYNRPAVEVQIKGPRSPLEQALGDQRRLDQIKKKYGMEKKQAPSVQWEGDNES